MEKEILLSFQEFLEKQDMLSKLTQRDALDQYGYSEVHCLHWIFDIENPNVTMLAEKLQMTRGAISKITQKLLKQGIINKYQKEDNRKEVYFKLSRQGKGIYNEHLRRHQLWEQRDMSFLAQFDQQVLEQIETFMYEYNKYLQDKIRELEEK